MAHQKRVLLLYSGMLLLSLGAAVSCRADDVGTQYGVSAPQDAMTLCVEAKYPCVSLVPLSSQTVSVHAAGGSGLESHHRSQKEQTGDAQTSLFAMADDGMDVDSQTATTHAPARDVNFSLDSTGAGIDTNMGRLAFSVTLDNYYHNASNQEFLEPQFFLNYARAW